MAATPKAKGRGKKPSGTPRRRRGRQAAPHRARRDGAGARRRRRPSWRRWPTPCAADGGAVLAAYREPLGGHALHAGGAARRQGRADAVPARHLRRPRAPADAGDGQDQALPRSDHRGARADRRRGVLDAQRLPPADRAQGAGRQDHPGAAGARARGRLPDPRAQHREGAQPAREGDRRAPHVRRPRADRRTATRRPFALEFEEPALATLGFAYEERGRLSGGAYHPILRKVDAGCPGKLRRRAARAARARAALLLDSTRR